MLKSTFKVSFLLMLVALLASACTFPWEKNRNIQDASLITYIANNQKTSGPSGDIKTIADQAVLKDFLFGHSAATSITGVVPGADNNELVHVEGNYIYTLVKNDVLIINSLYAPQAKIVGQISLPSRPLGILVSGQRLAVYGVDSQIKASTIWNSFKRESNYVFFKVYDVADPANPKELRDLSFEGEYAGVKLIGGHAYLMTAANINYIENEPLTPRVLEGGQVISGDCQAADKCLAPKVSYFDANYNNFYFLSATAISLADTSKELNIQDYLLDSSQAAYSPSDDLYLTYTSSVSEYDLQNQLKREQIFEQLSANDQAQIKEIEALPDTLLSAPEKAVKVTTIINDYLATLSSADKDNIQAAVDAALVNKIKASMNDIEKTAVYKIIFDAGQIEYQAKGNIFGQIVSGSGLSEVDGYVRIVTTRNELWSKLFTDPSKSYSNLYVLDDGLRLAGKLENIATSAQIRGVKFMGRRAYLKTAKTNDALYVADFADNTQPGILGAVQLPNSSSHIYQADEQGGIILSFGRDVEVDSAGAPVYKGLKLSLFDFTDLQNPKELSSYVIGGANSISIALDDYRALYNSIDDKIVAVPAGLYENGHLSFSGALVFSSADNSLTLKGRVDHSLGGRMSSVDSWEGFSYYDNTVRRSLISDTNLLTFSNKFLKLNKLTDLSTVDSFILTPGEEDYIINQADGQEIGGPNSSDDTSGANSDGSGATPALNYGDENTSGTFSTGSSSVYSPASSGTASSSPVSTDSGTTPAVETTATTTSSTTVNSPSNSTSTTETTTPTSSGTSEPEGATR